MRPDLEKALVRDFPALFRERHAPRTGPHNPISYGFEVEDGWEPVIRRLANQLEPIARETDLRAVQVKEKLGALRFYMDGVPAAIAEAVQAAISAAKEESSHTCEHCGAAGSTRDVGGWWLTLCDACGEREQARRPERRRRRPEGIRLWLDDVRPAPAGWAHAKTARQAIVLLETGDVVELSLDHDLGDEATCGTGYGVATWIEEQVALHGFVPPKLAIHSANVVGRERMQRAIESIERLRHDRTGRLPAEDDED